MASNLFCNDGSLPDEPELAFCRQTQSLPLEAPGAPIHTADLSAENRARLAARHGPLPFSAISKSDLVAALEQRFRSELMEAATHGLERRHPELSARRVVAWEQGLVAAAILAAGVLGAWLAPFAAGVTLALLLCVGFVANALFRAVLVWAGAGSAGTDTPPDGADAALPRYSILVPLYREARVVEALVAALRALDYPPDRLEIALVAEADDDETLTALAAAPLDERFFVLAVPPGLPRTKPKAANYVGIVSAQLTLKAAGAFDTSVSAGGAVGRQIELRLLYGTSFSLFGRHGFFDAEIAQRWIAGARADEVPIDFTLGLRVTKRARLLLQSFNTIAQGNASSPYGYYRVHKISLSVVTDIRPGICLESGAYMAVAGQNALAEKGFVVRVWLRF